MLTFFSNLYKLLKKYMARPTILRLKDSPGEIILKNLTKEQKERVTLLLNGEIPPTVIAAPQLIQPISEDLNLVAISLVNNKDKWYTVEVRFNLDTKQSQITKVVQQDGKSIATSAFRVMIASNFIGV